jgi:hypothetical protein
MNDVLFLLVEQLYEPPLGADESADEVVLRPQERNY